jgi:actin-related protein 8
VVDIGAQTTSIACIDEGVQLVDSRVTINIGGDDITRTFASFLTDNSFPYHALDLSRPYDWRLVEELKEKWCTMNEAEISVQVYDFFVRAPHQHTYKYQCKVYDEVFLAPLCLVYPNILKGRYGVEEDEVAKNNDGLTSSGVIDDIGADELSVSGWNR